MAFTRPSTTVSQREKDAITNHLLSINKDLSDASR